MNRKDLLFLMISGFIIAVVWITFNIYHNAKTSTIPEATSIQIAPISPSFDTKTIDEVRKRKKVSPVFEINTNPTPPIGTSSAVKQSTVSASLKP
ncbi:MAG: hypothetical protein HYV37_00900 [Candidatus Levyibacteriota bacterium]|nr:MAG: hypothetical protein HYV37_00900 [Candidatus Levybacteria bacterium]